MAGIVGVGIAADVVISMLRTIFFIIDGLIYGLVGLIYDFAISMYDIGSIIDSSSIITNTKETIYAGLAIAMFFKVAFSLLQMLVDPALIEDKQKGAGKLATNVVLCLILIVAVPFGFRKASELQELIIEERIIEQAVYGTDSVDDSRNLGYRLALTCWGIFLHPQDTALGVVSDNKAREIWQNFFNPADPASLWDASKMLLYLNHKAALITEYNFSYAFLISTIFGIYLAWTMLKLAVDIAYRSLKFLALEVISPIAVVSFIDPKSSKDGIFAKWLQEVFKTYASLFIRIFVFALASVILYEFSSNLSYSDSNILKDLILILAAVAFIKTAPKFFDKIFGTELSKESETKFATDMLRGGFGAVGGAAVGLTSAAVMGKGLPPKTFAKTLAKSGWQGLSKGYESGKKGNVRGVVDSYVGTYSGIKKSLGFEAVDKDYEREVSQMIPYAQIGKQAKGDASKAVTPDVIKNEFTRKRSINGYDFDLHAGIGDAEVEGAQKKYEAIRAENSVIPGVSDEGNRKYAYVAYMKKEAKQIGLIKDQAEREYSRRVTYTSDTDKELELKASYERDGKTKYASWEEMYGTSDVNVAFKKKVNDDIKVSTGLGVDKWANVAETAESDAKGAEETVATHEKTTVGLRDKRKREIYTKAKGRMQAENWKG